MIEKFLDAHIQQRWLRITIEWVSTIVLAFILYMIIQTFVFKVAYVEGVSMEPTFHDGDRVLVSQIPYWFGKPGQGDVIAFPFRQNPQDHFIKRIMGVPGDVIDFQDGGFLRNGELLTDDFSNAPVYMYPDITLPFTVPEGEYFVLGDNRNESTDSRYQIVGCVPEKEIMGKVRVRIWPLSRIGLVK